MNREKVYLIERVRSVSNEFTFTITESCFCAGGEEMYYLTVSSEQSELSGNFRSVWMRSSNLDHVKKVRDASIECAKERNLFSMRGCSSFQPLSSVIKAEIEKHKI